MAKTSPEPAAGFLRLERFYLGAACFTSGAALMVIELSAARLLAPTSMMDTVGPDVVERLLAALALRDKYAIELDRESASELLSKRAAERAAIASAFCSFLREIKNMTRVPIASDAENSTGSEC